MNKTKRAARAKAKAKKLRTVRNNSPHFKVSGKRGKGPHKMIRGPSKSEARRAA